MNADLLAEARGRLHFPWGARVQFILKHREQSGGGPGPISSGLLNSAKKCAELLAANGRIVDFVEVIDNNDIDREVTRFRPDFVIIEAYWVVPSKFDALKVLHPSVVWVVRNHSEIPFLASEGVAIEWTFEYLERGIWVASNSLRCDSDFRAMAQGAWPNRPDIWVYLTYLPNYYAPVTLMPPWPKPHVAPVANIGCFCAARLLKNQLQQAIAAIRFADYEGIKLRFHVNGDRVEFSGDPVMKNLIALFAHQKHHELVIVPWLPNELFLDYLRKEIDISMQMSFSETFNIVTADAIASAVPVLASPEIFWLGPDSLADPNSGIDIADKLSTIWNECDPVRRIKRQAHDLYVYSENSRRIWLGP